jgi:general L-amino acid transport system permease protein
MSTQDIARHTSLKVVFYNDPKIRSLFFQVLLLVAVVALFWFAYDNTVANLKKRNIAQGFAFWNVEAGFDISQTLISYSAASSYGRAFWVGLLNTLLVSGLSIFFATLIGLIVGILRLSKNWVVSRLAGFYIELFRNIPLLLVLYFWYGAVLSSLPEPRNSLSIPGDIWLNSRGLLVPRPVFLDQFWVVGLSFAIAIVGTFFLLRFNAKRQAATGERLPAGWISMALILGLPLFIYFFVGQPLGFDLPVKGRFNLTGGLNLAPELVAMVVGLSTYTAAFIAEAVRAGVVAVSKGQSEAAHSLGLNDGQTLRLVVLPQALRVIVPPLNSEFLSLTKNSTLGVSIGYPDLVNVFTGTVLNQTGQAVEMVSVTMLVYLTFSLLTSAFMNWFNTRVALVER